MEYNHHKFTIKKRDSNSSPLITVLVSRDLVIHLLMSAPYGEEILVTGVLQEVIDEVNELSRRDLSDVSETWCSG